MAENDLILICPSIIINKIEEFYIAFSNQMHFPFCKLPVLAFVHLPNDILCSSYQYVQICTQEPPWPATTNDDKRAIGTGWHILSPAAGQLRAHWAFDLCHSSSQPNKRMN